MRSMMGLLIVTWAATGWAAPLVSNGITAWQVPSATRITPRLTPPADAEPGGFVDLAREEYENCVVLVKPTKDLPLPAAKVRGLDTLMPRVRWSSYVPIHRSSGRAGVTGEIADPLHMAEPKVIPAGRVQPIWVTFRADQTLAPGTYNGTLVLTSDNVMHLQFPLKVKVRKIQLPTSDLVVRCDLSLAQLVKSETGNAQEIWRRYREDGLRHGANFWFVPVPGSTGGWPIHDSDMVHMTRLGLRYALLPLGWVRADKQHRWPAQAEWSFEEPVMAAGGTLVKSLPIAAGSGGARPTQPGGATRRPADKGGKGQPGKRQAGDFALRQAGGAAKGGAAKGKAAPQAADKTDKGKPSGFDQRFEDTLELVVREIAGHYRKIGWLSRSYAQFIDAPDMKDANTVAWIERVCKLLKKYDKDVRIALNCAPQERLLDDVSLWVVPAKDWEEHAPLVEKARQRKAEVLLDHDGIALIDCGPMRTRTFPWGLWRTKADGTFTFANLANWDENAKPWLGQFPENEPNGDGMLYYPPREGIGGPVGSSRLEAWRDGLEDHRLLAYARFVNEKRQNKELREALAEANTVMTAWPKYKPADEATYWTDPAKLEALRTRIMDLAEK